MDVPSHNDLEDRLDRAQEAGANYFKLAALIRNRTKYDQLAQFVSDHATDNLIIVGMGPGTAQCLELRS